MLCIIHLYSEFFLLTYSYVIFFSRFLYPAVVTFLTATISFPLGLGKYFASNLSTDEQVSIKKRFLFNRILLFFFFILHSLKITLFLIEL